MMLGAYCVRYHVRNTLHRGGNRMMLKTPENRCPTCRKLFTAVFSFTQTEPPREGEATICTGCTTFLAFNADCTTRALSEQEIAELHPVTRADLEQLRMMFMKRQPCVS